MICSIKSDSVVSITCSCSNSLPSSFIYFDLVSIPSNSMADCIKVVSLPYQMISFRINCSIPSYTCVYVLSGRVLMYMSSRIVSVRSGNVDVTIVNSFINASFAVFFLLNFHFLSCAICSFMKCNVGKLFWRNVTFGWNMPLLWLVCFGTV